MVNTFSSLRAGELQFIPVMIRRTETASSSNGNPYQRLHCTDTEGREFIVHNWNKRLDIKPPFICQMQISTEESQGSFFYRYTSYTLDGIETYNESHFLPKSLINEKTEWKFLVAKCKGIREPLKRVVGVVLNRNREAMLSTPLSFSDDHARRSGTLEATTKLLRMAELSAEICGLDRDLMIAGASIYYIGALKLTSSLDEVLFDIGIAGYEEILYSIANDEEIKSQNDTKVLSHIILSGAKDKKAACREALALKRLSSIIRSDDLLRDTLADTESYMQMKIGGYGMIVNTTSKENKKQEGA